MKLYTIIVESKYGSPEVFNTFDKEAARKYFVKGAMSGASKFRDMMEGESLEDYQGAYLKDINVNYDNMCEDLIQLQEEDFPFIDRAVKVIEFIKDSDDCYCNDSTAGAIDEAAQILSTGIIPEESVIEQDGGPMSRLSQRNYELLTRGMKTCGGNMDIYHFIQESLYIGEAQIIYAFVKWMVDNDQFFGHGNYQQVYAEFYKEYSVEAGDS